MNINKIYNFIVIMHEDLFIQYELKKLYLYSEQLNNILHLYCCNYLLTEMTESVENEEDSFEHFGSQHSFGTFENSTAPRISFMTDFIHNEIKISNNEINSDILLPNVIINNKYIIESYIGTGCFGIVYKASDITDINKNIFYAIKYLKQMKSVSFDDICNEIKLLQNIDCKYIVKIKDVIYNKEKEDFYIISDYIAGGHILTYIDGKCNIFPKKKIVNYIEKIVKALIYLKKNKIIHDDIKPDNILIDEYDNPILIDFGVSKILKDDVLIKKNNRRNIYFASPEILNGEEYSYNSDVWALGCIIYSMIYGKHPFYDTNVINVIDNITECKYIIPLDQEKEVELFKSIFIANPLNRITIENLLQMNYFSEYLIDAPDIILRKISDPYRKKLIKTGSNSLKSLSSKSFLNKSNSSLLSGGDFIDTRASFIDTHAFDNAFDNDLDNDNNDNNDNNNSKNNILKDDINIDYSSNSDKYIIVKKPTNNNNNSFIRKNVI